MPHVKAAKDGGALPNFYGEIKGIFWAKGEILPGIKDKS
jgi:hypothetical protein